MLETMIPDFRSAKKRKVKASTNDLVFSATGDRNPSRKMPLGLQAYSLLLALTGSITTPAVPAGTVRALNPLQIFRRFRFRMSRELVEVSLVALYFLDAARRQAWGAFNGISSAEAALASTTSTFSALIHLDFVEPGFLPMHEGVVNTSITDDVGYSADSGSGISDIIDGAAAGTLLNDTRIRVGVDHVVPQNRGLNGYGFQQVKTVYDNTFTSTADAAEKTFTAQGPLYWLMIESTTGANKNYSDTPMPGTGTIKLVHDGETLIERTVQDLRDEMTSVVLPPGMPTGVTTGGFLLIPFLDGQSERAGMPGSKLQAPTLKANKPTTLYFPVTGAATNEFTFTLVTGIDPDVLAATIA